MALDRLWKCCYSAGKGLSELAMKSFKAWIVRREELVQSSMISVEINNVPMTRISGYTINSLKRCCEKRRILPSMVWQLTGPIANFPTFSDLASKKSQM